MCSSEEKKQAGIRPQGRRGEKGPLGNRDNASHSFRLWLLKHSLGAGVGQKNGSLEMKELLKSTKQSSRGGNAKAKGEMSPLVIGRSASRAKARREKRMGELAISEPNKTRFD